MNKRIWLNRLALIFLVFLFSHILLIVNMLLLELNEFFVSANFFRMDSGNYLWIANEGLIMNYCDGEFSRMLRDPYRCGSAGWFPGYSYLIQLINPLIGDIALTGMYVSKFFFVLGLGLFTLTAKLNQFKTKEILLTLCFTVFFGSIYYHAIFPISQFLFFALGAIYFAEKGKLSIASLFVFAATYSYSTGFLLGGALSLALFIQHFKELKKSFFKILLPSFSSILALVIHFINLHFKTGHWNAFFMIQGRYGHQVDNPLSKVQDVLNLFASSFGELTNFIYLQSIIILIGFVVISFYFIKKKLYKKPLLLLSYCYVAFYLLFPYSVGSEYLSLYRLESLLIPMLFFVAELRNRYILFIFIILYMINLPMNHLFFKEILI